MYQKSNNHQSIYPSLSDSVRRAVIEYEERAAFVKSVCEAATECRFGQNRTPQTVKADINPQIEAVVWDVSIDVQQSHYNPSSLGRQRKGRDKSGVRTTMKDENSRPGPIPHDEISPAFLTPNQGRGSP